MLNRYIMIYLVDLCDISGHHTRTNDYEWGMPILFCVKQDRINMSKLCTTTLSMLPGPRRGSSSQSKIKAIVVPCGPASFNFWHLEPGAELLASYGYPYAWLNVALDIWRSRIRIIRSKSCIGTTTFLHASMPTIMLLRVRKHLTENCQRNWRSTWNITGSLSSCKHPGRLEEEPV